MPGSVTVASKLPHGLILQLQVKRKRMENVMGLAREVEYHEFTGKRVVIAGAAYRSEQGPRVPLVGGYALTHDVDADFFAKWLEINKDSDAVRNGMIFAHVKPEEAAAIAKESKDHKSGFEPIDPMNLPPEFTRKGKPLVETAERVDG